MPTPIADRVSSDKAAEEVSRERLQTLATQTVERLGEIMGRLRKPGAHLQHAVETWSNFLILPLFASLNTGLLLFGSGFDITAPASLDVIVGLLTSKPVGICLAAWLVLRTAVTSRSEDIGWQPLVGAGCLCGIGFTMSIFIAGASTTGQTLETIKLGVLLASTAAALIDMTILWLASNRKMKEVTKA